MMGCPHRLDDVMNAYTHAWYDIYTHMHDIIILNDSQGYSDILVESFTPCFTNVYCLLVFIPYILGTLFVLTSRLPGDVAFHARMSGRTG